ncbi:MAG: hypothetical protein V1780_01920 [Chloroflexota bacterium]
MLRLKGCPRCYGDLLVDRDEHGWYEQCIQCGYQHDLPQLASSPYSQMAPLVAGNRTRRHRHSNR